MAGLKPRPSDQFLENDRLVVRAPRVLLKDGQRRTINRHGGSAGVPPALVSSVFLCESRTPDVFLRSPNPGPEPRFFYEPRIPNPEYRFFYEPRIPNPEPPIPNPASFASPRSSRPHVLPLPATEEEFRRVLVRALDLEAQPGLAQTLSQAIWERLGVWHGRHEEETGNLNRFFQTPLPDDADERDRQLRERGETLPDILDLPIGFQERLTDLTWKVNQELDQWLEVLKAREEAGSTPASAPRKPPVGVDLDEAAGSKGQSEVA